MDAQRVRYTVAARGRHMTGRITSSDATTATIAAYLPELKCLTGVQLARETTCLSVKYALPDGQTVSVGPERFWSPEVLFNPALLGSESAGAALRIMQSLVKVGIDVWHMTLVLAALGSEFSGTAF